MKDDYRLQITVSPQQAHLIQKAMDLYTRMGIGQMEAVAEAINETNGTDCYPFAVYNPVREKLIEIKESILHQPRNGNKGITHPDVAAAVKTVYDILKSIQKGIATAEDHGSHSVWHDGDILHLGTEPTPEVNIIRGEEVTPVAVNQHR